MKKDFTKYLTADHIINLKGKTKREVLSQLIEAASLETGIDSGQIDTAVWQREKMMTTGIGDGLALPHIRIPNFGAPLVMVGICAKPVKDYATLDEKPVKIIVFIIAPEGEQEDYLKLLGSVSSKFKKEGLTEDILALEGNSKKICALIKKA